MAVPTPGGTAADHLVEGTVAHIQHWSVHDGPGIRTLVFLKGCPLRCIWCANPETQEFFPERGWNAALCRACGACAAACPQCPPRRAGKGPYRPSGEVCRACLSHPEGGPCVRACPSGALTRYGETRRVGEVLDAVEEDAVFYRHGGGGLTLSGGEALARPEFALALLREARRRCLRTALETCGHVDPAVLLQACALLDYLLYDVKTADEAVHVRVCGVSNRLVLSNLRAARRAFPHLPIRVRTPVVPGVNATDEAVRDLGGQLRPLGGVEWELLPYHACGAVKYAFLGRPEPRLDVPDAGLMDALRRTARAFARVV